MTKFTLNVERAVLMALKNKPGTLKQLAERTGINYYSVRNAIHELNDAGAISTRGVATRNQVFIATENAIALYQLPTIKVNGKKTLITNLLAWAGNEQKSGASAAVASLPRHVSRILMLCTAIQSDINVAMDLRRIRKEMEGDREALKRMINIYDQLLNNDSVWNADALKALVKHPDYDPELITNTYRHYYPNG